MIKIGVVGAAGKMGRMIMNSIVKNENTELSSGLEIKGHNLIGTNCGDLIGIKNINAEITDDFNKFIHNSDVIIDFSSIESTLNLIDNLKKTDKKLVVGTTGLNSEQVNIIKDFGKNNSVVFSPNMSLGVNLLFEITKQVTQAIGNIYDIEIIESHHNQKKDSPSGTAAELAKIIAETVNRNLEECGVYGRQGLVGKRKKEEIGIHAVRAGDIVGEHTVMFAGNNERIELIHRAHNRETFANGSVQAAVWLADKEKGYYTMKDVLEI